MKLVKILLIFISTTMFLQAQVSANFGTPKFTPPDGKKLLVIGQDLGAVGGLNSYSSGYIDGFTSHLPAGVTSYTSLPSLEGLKQLDNWGAGDVHAEAYFNDATFNNTFLVIGLYLVNVLEDINNGTIDDNIREFAAWVKEKDRPVFIRIGYEFDLPSNNYDPTQYKNAWKHIVHIFDTENVKNAAYVWQSYGLNNTNIIDWYPGDDYVNWVGYSYFDGANLGQSIIDFAEEYNKPIMITEATPRVDLQNGNHEIYWSNWFEPLFNKIYNSNRIKSLAYINVDWDSQMLWNGLGWGDSRVQEVPYIKEKWETEITKSAWITANDDILDILNYSDWTTLSNIENEEDSNKNPLIVKKKNSNLLISTKDNDIINEVYILDYSGSVLFKSKVPNLQHTFKTDLLYQKPIIILAKLQDDILHTKKLLFTQE